MLVMVKKSRHKIKIYIKFLTIVFFHFLFQVAYAGYASPYYAGYANAGYPYAHHGYTGYPYAVAAPVAAAAAA